MTLGAGLQWQDVYTRAVNNGLNVLGGRFATVGVSGILLGGGYSWISNKHALASDNVVEYTMVTPGDSKIRTVTNDTNPDLFFALKGGLNNFGIVTNFKVKAYPQTNKVWAGTIYTLPNNSDASVTALTNFAAKNTDPNAQVIGSFVYGNNSVSSHCACFILLCLICLLFRRLKFSFASSTVRMGDNPPRSSRKCFRMFIKFQPNLTDFNDYSLH